MTIDLALPPGERAAFLGIERSLGGRRWRIRLADERMALMLAQRLDIPEMVARVLAGRGIGPDEAEAFLNPTLRDQLPDPSHLKDMDAAVARLVPAIMSGERICIFGDYDVDGATSAALLHRFFTAAGGVSQVYVPDRIAEGYGPNTPALLRLKDEGVSVVVTVDCGITAFEPLKEAAAAGLDVIVVDHHEAEPELPRAIAVVNPNRLDETSQHGHMAAVGVAFLVAVAVHRGLKSAGWYAGPGPDLMQWLDIVALGTVCDVVPLVGVNRALVAQGLKVMARRGNAGLAALADVAGVRERPDAYHLGYVMGPRVNAGGRVGQSDLGARLLSSDDPDEAAEMARRLDQYNRERQEIEAAVLQAAIDQAEADAGEAGPVLVVCGDGWHPGVIGIVAGRLKERYNRPALVVAFDGNEGKGSGRSVRGVDLGSAVIAARQAGILSRGGGHTMAAGFSLERERLGDFRAFLGERFASLDQGLLIPVLELDGAVDASAATLELVEVLRRVGPFGSGNSEPRFAIAHARVLRADIVGQGHVRCILGGARGGRLKAIAFRCAETDLGQALLHGAGQAMHVAGSLRLDTWQGQNGVQMFLDDAAFAR